MNLDNQTIAVIGLGYVGLPLALAFGATRKVVGFDISCSRIEALRRHEDATLEATAADFAAARHLCFSSDPEDLRQCGVFIVTVPTPIDKANRPDLTPLLRASETVGKAISRGAVVIFEFDRLSGLHGRGLRADHRAGIRPRREPGLLPRLQPGAHQSRATRTTGSRPSPR